MEKLKQISNAQQAESVLQELVNLPGAKGVEYCEVMLAASRCAHEYGLPELERQAYRNLEKVVSLEIALPVLHSISMHPNEHDMNLCSKLREHCWKAMRNFDSDEFVSKLDSWIFSQLCAKNSYE